MSRRAYPHRPGTKSRDRGRTLPLRWLRSYVTWGLAIGGLSWAVGSAFAQPPATQPGGPPTQQPPTNNPPVAAPGPRVDPVLPPPKPLSPPPLLAQPGGPRPHSQNVLGGNPKPNARTAEKHEKYIDSLIDPEAHLDLITGQTRLLVLKETPKRIQISDDAFAEYNLLTKNQMSLMGKQVGVTTMTLWFADPKDPTKEDILVYNIRVLPSGIEKENLIRTYKALQDEINRTFPDSVICLSVVGDKLVVTGHAKDIAESTQILKIIRANATAPGGHSRTARIPLDRQVAGRDPNRPEEPEGQALTPGVEDYLIEGASWIVNMIRVPGEQTVNLRVTIAEVNRTAARSIGLNFVLLNNNGTPYLAQNTGSLLSGQGNSAFGSSAAFGNVGLGANGFIPGVPGVATGNANILASLDNGQVRLAINAMRNLHYARLMAEPNLTTINGQTAFFRAGGQFPVPVVSGGVGVGGVLQGVLFRNYGIDLSFTPYITDRDRLRLVLNADVTALDAATGTANIGGTNIPYLNQRQVNTTVELREGQTLAVAGLIQNNLSGDASRVPLFGDLPIIGNFFGFNRVSAGDQELVILVTPELVHPIDCKDRLPLPGSDLFEPTDFEFYVLGRLESHRNADYRSPIRTDWSRIRQYRTMEANYINGPSGYSDLPCADGQR